MKFVLPYALVDNIDQNRSGNKGERGGELGRMSNYKCTLSFKNLYLSIEIFCFVDRKFVVFKFIIGLE